MNLSVSLPISPYLAALILALVELVSYGVFAHRLGFYHDDWHLLEVASAASDLPGAFTAFRDAGVYASRPANLLWLPPLYRLGGLEPLFYQIALLALDVLQGLLLFTFLKGLTRDSRFSLLAAALALMSPNRAVTHVWFANAPQGIAIALTLGALVLHQRWLERRRWSALVFGQAAYLLGLLTYESAAFLPLMLAGGLAARRLFKDLWPFAATLLGALLWQRLALPLLSGAASPKSLGFSPLHALKAYGAGLECLTNRVLHASWKAWPGALESFGLLLVLGCAALALLLAKALLPLQRGDIKTPLGIAALGFLGAYAPYALSASYMPQAFGLMSRTNAAGALILGVLLAAGISRLAAKGQLAATAILACAFTGANWGMTAQWARSWDLQRKILEKAAARASELPKNANMVLTGAPGYLDHAIVFDASWDFGPALRLATGRRDLWGTVSTPRSPRSGGIYVFDYEADRLYPSQAGK